MAESDPAEKMKSGAVPPIVDTITTGTLFRRVNNQLVPAPQTAKTAKIKADPEQEYVASAPYYLAATYLRSLSFAIDDITADFGADLYDRMMLDSQVSSDVHIIKMGILAQGIQVRPAVKRWDADEKTGKRTENPRWKKAKEIADFCARNLVGTQIPFATDTANSLYWAFYNLLDALPYGNKVAEKILVKHQAEGDPTPRVYLKALKCKPRRSLAFVVDPYLNLLAFLGLVPGQAMPVLTQALVGDPAQIPNLLPRRHFCCMTFRPKDGDPRGQSILRPAYDPWFVKQQIKIERLGYLARFTGGGIIGFTAENATEQDILDDNGAPLLDENGLTRRLLPEQAMMNALINYGNGAVAAFPYGAKVEVHYPPPETPFEAALDRQDREISQAIKGETRSNHEAQHGSKADSEGGQDILGLLVKHGKAALETVIREDILRDLVEMNWGPAALDLLPIVSLSETEQQDFAVNATAVAELKKADYFAPSQLPEVDAKLSLPIRTEEEAEAQTQDPATAPTAPKSPQPGGKPAPAAGPKIAPKEPKP